MQGLGTASHVNVGAPGDWLTAYQLAQSPPDHWSVVLASSLYRLQGEHLGVTGMYSLELVDGGEKTTIEMHSKGKGERLETNLGVGG